MELNDDICYRAVKSRDARFDGRFFTAVRTTGIYCRPVCPAVAPKAENCVFYACAAAAQEAGFRPCLRCRPELSPDMLQQLSKSRFVARALKQIDEGALDECSVEDLATRLGIGERHLRRLFQEELGATPLAVGQTKRVLMAKQLLTETSLSMSDVALASGFGSIRRFNDVIKQVYQRMPSELRRTNVPPAATNTISVKLPYRAPYNWEAFVAFLKPRITPGVEEVTDKYYRRTISLQGKHGIIEVASELESDCLRLTIDFPLLSAMPQIVSRVKNMFDCSANIEEIDRHLKMNEHMKRLVLASPGLRVPGAWDRFELAVRAILGQQISVAAATTMAGRTAASFGSPYPDASQDLNANGANLNRVFPDPKTLANADLTTIGLTKSRAKAISGLAAVVAESPQILEDFADLSDAVQQLCALPGIGEWTANYIAMRALREPDAFPGSDLGLLKGFVDDGVDSPKDLLELAENWRPWRAYAAMHIWRGLALTEEKQKRAFNSNDRATQAVRK